jgi:hypothetical protein
MSADERLVTLAKRAAAATEKAGLSGELRALAFGKFLDRLLADDRAGEPSSRAGVPNDAEPLRHPPDHTVPERLLVLARRLGVEAEAAEYVYDTSGSDLTLVLARSRLPAEKRRATRIVALLYAAGRQAAYDEEWTRMDHIREQCRLFGVLDPPNFAAALAATADALLTRGKGSERAVRLTRAGFEEAGRLIREMVG